MPVNTPTPPAPTQTAPGQWVPSSVRHYENFPVASFLCPPRLRPAIAALYAFARTADDIADEGDAPPEQRLADLSAYRAELQAAARAPDAAARAQGRWPDVFGPLAEVIARHRLPLPLLNDLLDAFTQDVVRTRDGAVCASHAELLDYCRRSANPIGRLLLHLYGVNDARALAESDAICSALQLVNFWQDLRIDIPRGRYYLPQDRCTALGVDPRSTVQTPQASRLIAENVQQAVEMLRAGAGLPLRLPGRAGWELRLVVQGGLRIAEKISAQHHTTLQYRPTLGKADLPRLLWRALFMR